MIGPSDSDVARRNLAPFDPNAVIAFGPDDEIPPASGKDFVDGRPAVYVCENFGLPGARHVELPVRDRDR